MGTPLPATALPLTWDPAAQEPAIYQRWIDAGHFSPAPGSDRAAYTIVLAPPNVTGSLHMGHALEHTVTDALTRRRRMQGYEVLWLPGMDHAGIATQNVVERELAKEGLTRHDLGRARFVDRVWKWKAEYGGKILGQMRRLGDGVDWTRERFTMDEGLSRAVGTMFKRLYDDDLIYRAERIINWCPRCTTALSDIEVDHAESDGELVSIRYGDGESSIVVATTRAETMLGDTAVAVHPDDARYRHLVGRSIELPLSGRRIPIVADPAVDPSFGTGAVKVTPAHDPTDFEIGRRHDLAAPTVLDERGAISAPGAFHGLDRFEARAAIIDELRSQGRVTAEERPYRHAVGRCSRCTTLVEPRLSLQWWVRVEGMAEAAGVAVRAGRTTIHPPEQAKRYFDWVDNLYDWTISRQLWWGHQIPVWYGPDGEIVCVGPDDDPPSGDGWRQDPDVLDTWFSAGLWPMSTLGWPDDTADLRRFLPTSVLSTGYDILFFWVVRMMLLGLYATDGTPPFQDVYLHGLIRDAAGRKMSKSAGNVVDPLDWLDRYGADALRFTLARGANPGADLVADEQWADGSRRFCIKLWNAGRFALAHGADPSRPLPARERLTDADRWILDRVDSLVSEVDELFERFRFGTIRELLFHFVWNELCDWYLELAKVQLAIGGDVADSTRAVLGHVLDVTLRLLHPLLPFVTEALWTSLTGRESLVIAEWPRGRRTEPDHAAARRIAGLRAVVTEIRRFRAEHAVNAGQQVGARLSGMDSAGLSGLEPEVAALARLELDPDRFAPSASVRIGQVTVDLDLSAAVDPVTERARRDRQLAAAERELAVTSAKLANAGFLRKAPAEVVASVRARHAAALEELTRLR